MISKAYIHEYGNQKLEREHEDVISILESRNIPFELFTDKKVSRNLLSLDNSTFIVGNHFVFSSIFKKYKIKVPSNCYPKSLQKYLHRNVRETTVRELALNFSEDIPSIFVKPRSRTKLFTGFTVASSLDVYRLVELPKNTELYIAPVVEWKSEYRVFVNNSKVVGIKKYSGEDLYTLDMTVVENAINDLENSEEKTQGYGIDFGILSTGETALVEWNDGYALGSYGLDKEIYTDLLLARWVEILNHMFPSEN
ncbi:ATP-grasp domain-containing protein [Chryseobacterium sp. JK1]|uniref:ATP-grasp domain-containing protein n=1 Tax=Chryseobacterium sp. JK1 TaxID=874294 RepID=UPI003D682EC7